MEKSTKSGHEHAMRVLGIVHAALQHIEPFQDQDVRLLHHLLLVRQDVIDEVGADGGLTSRGRHADIGDKLHQMTDVIRLGNPLRRIRPRLPAPLLGNRKPSVVTSSTLGCLASAPAVPGRIRAVVSCPRHAAGDADDDVGALAAGLTEKLLQHPAAALLGLDVEIEGQTGGGRQISSTSRTTPSR